MNWLWDIIFQAIDYIRQLDARVGGLSDSSDGLNLNRKTIEGAGKYKSSDTVGSNVRLRSAENTRERNRMQAVVRSLRLSDGDLSELSYVPPGLMREWRNDFQTTNSYTLRSRSFSRCAVSPLWSISFLPCLIVGDWLHKRAEWQNWATIELDWS